MKRLNIIVTIFGLFTACTLSAQVDQSMSNMNSDKAGGIASETTEKTYKLVMNDKVIKNSVKINTTKTQELMLDKDDSGMVNQDQKLPKENIVKTIRIDNDADDAYDELIKFHYRANATSDFVLISNNNQLMVALDDGDNLQILEDQSFDMDDVRNGKEAYVFTDNNGKNVEFFIEDYETLNNSTNM